MTDATQKLIEAVNRFCLAWDDEPQPVPHDLWAELRNLRAAISAARQEAEQSASATSVQEQVGWSDEFGNLFPLAAYKPKSATWSDKYRTTWRPVYAPAPTPAQEPRPQGHNPKENT